MCSSGRVQKRVLVPLCLHPDNPLYLIAICFVIVAHDTGRSLEFFQEPRHFLEKKFRNREHSFFKNFVEWFDGLTAKILRDFVLEKR